MKDKGIDTSKIIVAGPSAGAHLTSIMCYSKKVQENAEKKILESYDCVQIDASFPAKRIYLKRGYKEVEYNIIDTENGDCLCYDVMRLEKADGQRG